MRVMRVRRARDARAMGVTRVRWATAFGAIPRVAASCVLGKRLGETQKAKGSTQFLDAERTEHVRPLPTTVHDV